MQELLGRSDIRITTRYSRIVPFRHLVGNPWATLRGGGRDAVPGVSNQGMGFVPRWCECWGSSSSGRGGSIGRLAAINNSDYQRKARLIEVVGVENIAQMAQSFTGEVVRFELVRGHERLYLGVYVESATIGGCKPIVTILNATRPILRKVPVGERESGLFAGRGHAGA